jgi:hypothetical protein
MYDPKRLAAFQKRRREAYTAEPSKVYLLHDEAGYSALAAAIINQAMKDLARVRRQDINADQAWISNALGFTPEEDLADYFVSEEFDVHCHILGIPPDQVRINIELEPAN